MSGSPTSHWLLIRCPTVTPLLELSHTKRKAPMATSSLSWLSTNNAQIQIADYHSE